MHTDNFNSRMTKVQYITAFVYFPLHLAGIPFLVSFLYLQGWITVTQANVGMYIFGLIYMLITQFTFLRREFDTLCDNFTLVIRTVLYSYLGYWAFNYLISIILLYAGFTDNPNQTAITESLDISDGAITAMTVFMAPIVEELMFRGALFGCIRRKNRTWAYIISVAAFSLYHVVSYAVYEPIYLVYLLQYIPVSWLLARCYEKTGSIWASIMLHMTVNGVSMALLNAL